MKNFWAWFFTVIIVIGLAGIIFIKATKSVGGKVVTGPQEASQLMGAGGKALSETVSAMEGNG